MPTYEVTWHLGQWVIQHRESGKLVMNCGQDWYNAHIYCLALNQKIKSDLTPEKDKL